MNGRGNAGTVPSMANILESPDQLGMACLPACLQISPDLFPSPPPNRLDFTHVLHLHNLNGNVVMQSGAQASPTLGKGLSKLPFWAAGIDGTGEVGDFIFHWWGSSSYRLGKRLKGVGRGQQCK